MLEAGGLMVVSGVNNSRTPNALPLLGGWFRLAVGGAKKAIDADASIVGVTVTREEDGTFNLHFTPLRERGEEQAEDHDHGQGHTQRRVPGRGVAEPGRP